MASLYHGSCTIQPTSIAFSSEELLDMIARCGLNRLRQFSSYIDNHLRNSKTDPTLLQALIRLDEVKYGGLPLGHEEEAWAVRNGINLLVNSVLVVTFRLSLMRHSPLVLTLYRTSSDPPK